MADGGPRVLHAGGDARFNNLESCKPASDLAPTCRGREFLGVIPALTEARNLPHVLARMPPGAHEVILVDGYSVDDTVAVARRLTPDVRCAADVGVLRAQSTFACRGCTAPCFSPGSAPDRRSAGRSHNMAVLWWLFVGPFAFRVLMPATLGGSLSAAIMITNPAGQQQHWPLRHDSVQAPSGHGAGPDGHDSALAWRSHPAAGWRNQG